MKRDGACISLWQKTTDEYHSEKNVVKPAQLFDVIIAGGGITGITTGLLLQKTGRSVLIAEAQSVGFGTSGGTTAHLNTFMDTPYNTLQKNFGAKEARIAAKAVRQALDLIKWNVQEYNIHCGYKEQQAYLFSQNEQQSRELDDIFKAARECRVDCSWSGDMPSSLPFEKMLMFAGQASFHPLRYLRSLAEAFERNGGILLENCRVTGIDEGGVNVVRTSRGNFRAPHFIYATHIPAGVNLLHFRCAPYRSYVITAKLENENDYPDALIYDMEDPYHYYRTQEIDGELYFIAGGEDHKTGHEENTSACFRKLEAHVRKYFPVKTIVNRWSSQYFEPADGLPYIGHLPGHPGGQYVATGYGGNGMMYSGVAALILTNIIAGNNSGYEELFDPNRIKMVAGFSNFVKESADVAGHLIAKALLPPGKLDELAELAPSEARVVKYEGHHLAIYKDSAGKIYALSSACTHIKCNVTWNNAEKTWDCPCHGSRFSYTGEVLTAPARKDLTAVEIMTEVKV